MKSNNKYDPEDIESLLLHKQFHELYPEEKEFVLRHLENEEEYNSMRNTLFEIKEISSASDLLRPDAGLKKELLRAFQGERKSPFIIWLNALFAAPDRSFFGQRGVQLSFSLAVIAIIGVFLFTSQPNKKVMAENHVEQNKEMESPAEVETKQADVEEEGITEESTAPVLPPAAVQINSADAAEEVNDVVMKEEAAPEAQPLTNQVSKAMADEVSTTSPQVSDFAVENANSENIDYASPAITNKATALSPTFNSSGAELYSEYTTVAIVETSSNIEGYADVVDLLFTAK